MFAIEITESWRQQHPIRPVPSHPFQVEALRWSLAALWDSVHWSGWRKEINIVKSHSEKNGVNLGVLT
jgi:hypothetical protein